VPKAFVAHTFAPLTCTVADTTSLNENVYGSYTQYHEVFDTEASRIRKSRIPFVARPQAFAVKVPAFFVSGLPTVLFAPLMLVGVQTYTDLLNIGNVLHDAAFVLLAA
jgi:hypothetical protein